MFLKRTTGENSKESNPLIIWKTLYLIDNKWVQLTPNKKYLLITVTSGAPSVSDPHEAIHGDLNQQIKIGEAADDDKEDFENWKRGNVRSQYF